MNAYRRRRRRLFSGRLALILVALIFILATVWDAVSLELQIAITALFVLLTIGIVLINRQ